MLPIIDLSAPLAGDSTATAAVAREINAACLTHGFFYIRNHGVPDAIIDRTVEQAKLFFRQPIEEKLKAKVNMRHRGFNALGDALMYGAEKPDYKEFFSIGLELPEDDPDVLAGQALRGPNNWPPGKPDFRAALSAYYDALGTCGSVLLRCVALSLGVAPDFFVDKYRKRLQRTQIIYYPPQPPTLGDNQFGLAAHTDFGCITLLWQDDNGGLEVHDRAADTWIPAPPIPGTLVINVGDLLGRWTNDRYASTPHRVRNTSGRERFSIATFYDPDYTATVDPRMLGIPDAECHYEATSAGEHILGRIQRSFGYRKKTE